nr:O-antigen ligase family protein [Qipengyuania vesicularis]
MQSRRFQGVTRRGKVLAGFLAVAMVLGGGGSPSPETEILLQICFAGAVLFWIWWASGDGFDGSGIPRPLVIAGAVILAIPLLQLVPLPPAIWQALPGREPELQALRLVGEQDSWRALSVSPHLTLAALLAMIPAVGAFWAASTLTQPDRRFLLVVIWIVALAGAALGVVQMAGGPDAFRLYEKTHLGWLTAFHANRNAAADVLLIGMLALSGWFAGIGAGPQSARQRVILFAAGQFILLAAVVMTGSRAGIALLLLTLPLHWLLLRPKGLDLKGKFLAAGAIAVALAMVILPIALSGNTRLSQVASRFDASSDARFPLWQDSWDAVTAFWPAGSGIGTFMQAFAPYESIEHLDQFFPNRAHNDYLEFLLEGGVMAPVLLAIAVVMLFQVLRRIVAAGASQQPVELVGVGILAIIALHSIVDYPLRNMAIACLAGVAAGLLPIGSPERTTSAGKGREGET